jgi:hypothetical protein
LRVGPCAARAAGRPSRFTPVQPGHASRSLFGATFRYPCFVEPFHNRAAHAHLVCRARRAATLMGFSHPSQCSPSAGPGVCDTTHALFARASISAVHPHLPLSNSHRAVYFYSCRSRARLLSQSNRLLPHTSE